MNRTGDYIKVFRSLLDWEWYKSTNTCRLFIHMLLKANWKDGKFEGIDVPRGSFVSSLKVLSKETGLSVQAIRTSINRLKSTGEITSTSYPKYSVFTVNNYESFQGVNTDSNTTSTQLQHDFNTTSTTIEERKKERKEEVNTLSKDNVRQTDVQRAVDKWNELTSVGIKSVSKLSSSSQRYDRLKARINEYGIDDVLLAIDKIKDSDFLQGKSKKSWVITFDWFVRPNNFPKVLEGNYDNNKDTDVKQDGMQVVVNDWGEVLQ